jgi:predicted MPP superfamily phosphohydrolase
VRKISERRRLVEQEGRQHSVVRGWRKTFHFENMPKIQVKFGQLLQVLGLKGIGWRNTLKVELNKVKFAFDDLPAEFDGFRILFVSDLHIDNMDELTAKLLEIIDSAEYDICVLGGDYTFLYGWIEKVDHSNLKAIAEKLVGKSRVVGVLGNHDMYSVAEILEEIGVEMLVNDNIAVEKEGAKIHIAGIDDCHYYGTDDLVLAGEGIEGPGFKVLVSHSPEQLEQAQSLGYDLYLAGHTHGGQVCLPGGTQIVKGASLPRKYLKGKWHYGKMSGYTSKGVGTSGTPVRFFCKPEVTVVTLEVKGTSNK